MVSRLISGLFCALLLTSSVSGQDDDSLWSRNFGPVGVSGTVKALQHWGDSLVVAGDILGLRQTGAFSKEFVIFDLVDRTWHLQETGPLGTDAEIRAVEELPNGDLVIGGDFSFSSNGMTFDNIAVLRKDGSWSTLSGDSSDQCTGPVNALLEYDDRLYIGGEFDQIGDNDTIITLLFAVWDESQGFLGVRDEPIGFIFEPGQTPAVYALLQVPGTSGLSVDQDILVGGNFVRAPGDSLGNVVRVGISNLSAGSSWVPRTNGPVYALARPGSSFYNNEIYVGGDFTIAGDSTVSNCVMYDQDDGRYDPLGDGLNGPVYAIKQYPASVSPLRFAGDFDSSGTLFVGSVPAWNFSSDSWETTPLTTSDPIYALESIQGNYLAVGGEFEFAGDSSLFHSVFLTKSPSQVNDSVQWSLGDGFDTYISSSLRANDVAVDDAGNFYVCGGFQYAGGVRVNNIAKWDGQKWRALGEGLGSGGGSIAVNGDTVYVSGNSLELAGGIPVSNIAMWDGSQWSDMDGGLSTGSAREMAIDTLGNLYVVGSGFELAGSVTVAGIARWDGSEWSAVGGPVSPGTPMSVQDIYIDSLTNEVYICGSFDVIDGVTCRGVAMWDGNSWTGLGNKKTGDGTPYVIERSPQGEIIMAGFLDRPEFITQFQDSLWIGYAGGVAVPDVSDLHTVGCHVYLTGDPLQFVGDESDPFRVYNVARWDGLEWQPLGPGVNGGIMNVAHYGNELAVAGDFTQLNGTNIYARGFAIWNGVVSGAESSDLTLLSPTVSDTLEYGTVFDITWDTATTADLVLVEVSLDSGVTWEVIHNRADAKRGRLTWLVPDTNAAYCKIRISDGNAPCAAVEEPFTFPITADSALEVRWLQRKAGTYYIEPFTFGNHSWAFANDSAVCWPEEYWQSFDYSTLPRPLRGIDDRSRFPDWWTFEDGWGEDYCFIRKKTPRLVRPAAYLLWERLSKRGWDGSCYGFAVSSLLAFRYQPITTEIILAPDRIRELPLNLIWRRSVNKYWSYQFGYKHLIFGLRHFNDTPMETLRLIRDSSMATFQLPRLLSMMSMVLPTSVSEIQDAIDQEIRGHTVVPYRIENMPDSLGIYRIYVYDNNFPGDSSTFIRVDSINSLWSYDPPTDDSDLVWADTCCGLFTSLPLSEFEDYPTDPAGSQALAANMTSEDESDVVMVMVSGREDILMTDSTGRQFGAVLGQWYNDDTAGFPIVPLQPDFRGPRPIGYMIPRSDYTVELSQLSDTVDVLWQTVDKTFRYRRGGGDSTHSEHLTIGDNAMSIARVSGLHENVSVSAVQTTDSSERYVELAGMTFAPIDSLEFSIDSAGAITIWNTGIAKAYQLILWNADAALAEDEMTQSFSSTLINSDMTQKIIPVWGMLEASTTLLLKDADQDGTFEDTTVMDIVTDVEDDGLPELPDTYQLGQNYPNPFNPSTTIDFSIPVAGDVMLEVINVLGQRVTTLVSQDLAAGEYTVVWNGTNAAGVNVASGIYFYRLSAEGFATSKKMLLLR